MIFNFCFQENKASENSTPSIFSGAAIMQQSTSHLPNHFPPLPSNSIEGGTPSHFKTISGRNITQLNELKLSNCIKTSDIKNPISEKIEGNSDKDDEEEEEEPEEEMKENGFHREDIAKISVIDEDYDT